jgi:hypothetical protein
MVSCAADLIERTKIAKGVCAGARCALKCVEHFAEQRKLSHESFIEEIRHFYKRVRAMRDPVVKHANVKAQELAEYTWGLSAGFSPYLPKD